IGPVSRPASIRKVEAPVTSSPASTACWTGAAPRHAGSSEKCRFSQPYWGTSSTTAGSRAPYATTGAHATLSSVKRDWKTGSRGESGVSTSSPAARARCLTGLGRTARPRPAGASGRVSTASTSCREASNASSAGRAVAGVPAKRSRMILESRSQPWHGRPRSPHLLRIHRDPEGPGLLACTAHREAVVSGSGKRPTSADRSADERPPQGRRGLGPVHLLDRAEDLGADRQRKVLKERRDRVVTAAQSRRCHHRRQPELAPFGQLALRESDRVPADQRLGRDRGTVSDQEDEPPGRGGPDQCGRSEPSAKRLLRCVQALAGGGDGGIQQQRGGVAVLRERFRARGGHNKGRPTTHVRYHASGCRPRGVHGHPRERSPELLGGPGGPDAHRTQAGTRALWAAPGSGKRPAAGTLRRGMTRAQ